MRAAAFIRNSRIARRLLLVGIATLCVGCPRPAICVTVPDKRAGSLVIELAEGSNCDRPAVVTRLIVRRISDDKVFWTIGSTDGVKVKVIRYGELPPGLDQGMAALPLAPGEHVAVTVDGRGSSGGLDLTVAP
jgi:hypothetical protein